MTPLDELAFAVARELHAIGYSVALRPEERDEWTVQAMMPSKHGPFAAYYRLSRLNGDVPGITTAVHVVRKIQQAFVR